MILPPLGEESDHLMQRSPRILYQGGAVPQVALFNPSDVVMLAQEVTVTGSVTGGNSQRDGGFD